jgi:hypothetical protein
VRRIKHGTQGAGLTRDNELRAFASAGAACLVCALLIGAAPALATRPVGLAQSRRDSHRVIGGRERGPSSGLLVGQVALSLALLVGAGLSRRRCAS